MSGANYARPVPLLIKGFEVSNELSPATSCRGHRRHSQSHCSTKRIERIARAAQEGATLCPPDPADRQPKESADLRSRQPPRERTDDPVVRDEPARYHARLAVQGGEIAANRFAASSRVKAPLRDELSAPATFSTRPAAWVRPTSRPRSHEEATATTWHAHNRAASKDSLSPAPENNQLIWTHPSLNSIATISDKLLKILPYFYH
jgi:hypothetical protein